MDEQNLETNSLNNQNINSQIPPEPLKPKSKVWVIWVCALILILLAGAAVYLYFAKKSIFSVSKVVVSDTTKNNGNGLPVGVNATSTFDVTSNLNATSTVVEIQLEKGAISKNFPVGVPWENHSEITNNVEFKDLSNGLTQDTRIYISQKTSDENYGLFLKYFQDKGWNVISTGQQNTVKSVIASLGSDRMEVAIMVSPDGKIIVSVTNIK